MEAVKKSGEAWRVTMRALFPYVHPNAMAYLINISFRCKAMYFETPKVGCSTIKRTLQLAELADVNATPEDVHDKASSPLSDPAKDFESFINALQDPNFIRFAFVRNPYTRILSCYLDKVVENEWERQRLLPQLGFSGADIVPFSEFLEAVSGQNVREMEMHWAPQSVLLSGQANLSFIGRFESFSEDFSNLRRVIGPNLPEVAVVKPHATDAAAKVQKYYGKKEIEYVTEIYKEDFQNFCYSRDFRFASAFS